MTTSRQGALRHHEIPPVGTAPRLDLHEVPFRSRPLVETTFNAIPTMCLRFMVPEDGKTFPIEVQATVRGEASLAMIKALEAGDRRQSFRLI